MGGVGCSTCDLLARGTCMAACRRCVFAQLTPHTRPQDDELRLAYVHSALGQTCLENGGCAVVPRWAWAISLTFRRHTWTDNFVGAFSDFNECLQLREAVLPAGDRCEVRCRWSSLQWAAK